jgi:uncharacterized membrane protein
MESKFTVLNVLSASWKALVSQIWILVGLFIGYIILSFVLGIVLSPLSSSTGGKLIVNLITLAISLIFNLGYLKNLFQALDGDEPRFSAYGQQARKAGVYLVSGLLCGLLVFAAFAVFVLPYFYLLYSYSSLREVFDGFLVVPAIPGGSGVTLFLGASGALILSLPAVYLYLRLMFFQAFIVEENAGIISSLSRSWKITKGQELPLFLAGLLAVGLLIAGFLALFAGLFVAVPLGMMMLCCVFRKLNTSNNIIVE